MLNVEKLGPETNHAVADLLEAARAYPLPSTMTILRRAHGKLGMSEPLHLNLRGNDAHRYHALVNRYVRHDLSRLVREGLLELRVRRVPAHDLWSGKPTGGETVLRTYHLTAAGHAAWLK